MIRAEGGEATRVTVDITDPEQTTAMAASAYARYGRIDGLVNNAGIFYDIEKKPFYDVTPEEWDRMLAVNVKGQALVVNAVFPYMRAQGSGRIVNIASNTIYRGIPNFIHYVASKGAIIAFTRALAREVADFGINVNAISPDYMPYDEAQPEMAARILADRLIKRPQVPADVLGALKFLLSSASDFVTGQSILVNGGVVMQ
jgi:NAD(P)-dependent dehydrogenase (short-subunit alcohol dehydrogenase family)